MEIRWSKHNSARAAALVTTATCLLLLVVISQVTAQPAPTAQQLAAIAECDAANFSRLYEGIHADLAPWRDSGISQQLIDWTLGNFTLAPLRSKGAAIMFQRGVPYLLSDPATLPSVGHHMQLILAHLQLMRALGEAYGAAIPDLEVVIGTADEPTSLTQRFPPGEAHPVLRFCKSDSFSDILVPYIHFQMRNFTQRLLQQVPQVNEAWPWDKKKEMLYGRFSPYKRVANRKAPELNRTGKGGKDICRAASTELDFCDVRKHFMWEWARGANRSGLPVDVAQQPKSSMLYHASHKWLLHLDGQSCSSRLEQLMALGSMVMKEASG